MRDKITPIGCANKLPCDRTCGGCHRHNCALRNNPFHIHNRIEDSVVLGIHNQKGESHD